MMRKISLICTIALFVLFVNAGSEKSEMSPGLKRIEAKNPKLSVNKYSPKSVENSKGPIVLFSQPVDTLAGTGCASQIDSLYPFRSDFVDDITPPASGWSADSIVTWWSNWNGFTTWDSVPNIHVVIYEDSGLATPMPKNNPYYEYVVDKSEYSVYGTYQVTMRFPTPLSIPGGAVYWIGFLPSNVYNNNGQTGIMSAPGIGNSQEAYIKFPEVGYVNWTTATAAFGVPHEIGMIIYGSETEGNLVWDFETGPQGWTHTKAEVFPGGWGVMSSGYRSDARSGMPGDSSMWIDSDTYGSGVITDTCYSPAVIPPTGLRALKWSCGFLKEYSEFLAVGIRACSSGVWLSPKELKRYTSSVSMRWDSTDVSSYSSYDSLKVFFVYGPAMSAEYASFDNVYLLGTSDHDVGVYSIVVPMKGEIPHGNYNVQAMIKNYGENDESFNATAVVYDTTNAWSVVFSNTIPVAAMPAASDTLLDFGSAAYTYGSVFCTKVYTDLTDEIAYNDTLTKYSWTTYALGDVVFEMDVETICGDNNIVGVEFDGEYFYLTGGATATDPNKVYVVDTLGNLIWTMDQPAHSTGWGWRDIAWDGATRNVMIIDTLYASVNDSVDKFGINLSTGTLNYYGTFPGPMNPNRALAYNKEKDWFYTANFATGCYKFNKDTVTIDSMPNTFSKYGAAYDTDSLYGDCIWWHTQDGLGVYVVQTDADSMYETGVEFAYVPTLCTSYLAGGASFYEGFRGMDILFCIVQGTPHDQIAGVFIRSENYAGVGGSKNPLKDAEAALIVKDKVSFSRVLFSYRGSKTADIEIKSVDGRIVKEFKNVSPATSLSFGKENTPSGVYFITVKGTGISEKVMLVK